MKVSLLAISVLLIACQPETSEPSRNKLIQAIDRFNDAFRAGNTDMLESMITANYTHTNSSWKSFGKEQWMKYMTSRRKNLENKNLIINEYEMDEMEIAQFENSAIVTARITTSGVENDVPFSKQFRVTNIWVYHQDRWLRAGFHDTLIE